MSEPSAAASPRPFSANGAADGPTKACRACRTANAEEADRCIKCQAWLPRNVAAVQTGVHRRQQPPDIQLTKQEFVEGVIQDLGGLANLSTLEVEYVSNLSHVKVLVMLLVNDLVTYGVFTPRGNPRRTYDALLAAIDRYDRLAQRIGLRRRGRTVQSPSDYLRSVTQPNEEAS
jgi:hypothetical protein